MDEATLQKYQGLIGKNIEYYIEPKYWKQVLGSYPKKYWGTLIDLKYSEKKTKFYAVIRRLERSEFGSVTYQQTIDTVPIAHILTRSIIAAVSPKASSNQDVDTRATWTNSSSTLQYGHDRYEITTADEMKIGDEVVWLRESVSALIGKIIWIGVRYEENSRSRRDVVAVVQFDQPTKSLPRYLQHSPANRNIVSLNELLHLSVWLELYDQTTNVGASSSDKTAIGQQLHLQQQQRCQEWASTSASSTSTVSMDNNKSEAAFWENLAGTLGRNEAEVDDLIKL